MIICWIYLVLLIPCITGCPNGWIQFGEKCYFFSDFAETFADAGSYCQISGSKLAEPLTDNEIAFLKHEVIQKKVRFFIGVVDYFIEGVWEYASSLLPIQSKDWGQNEPNSAGNEDCVEIVPSGVWADVTCERHLNFICERPISGGPEPEIIGK